MQKHTDKGINEGKGRKFGVFALIGEPNAGKSSLMNALLKTKLAPVSRKSQTTIRKLSGIITERNRQCMLLDTPGRTGGDIFRRDIFASEGAVNGVLIVIDAARKNALSRLPFRDRDPLRQSGQKPYPKQKKQQEAKKYKKYIVLNKIDLVRDKTRLLKIVEALLPLAESESVFMVSARTAHGVAALRSALLADLPDGAFRYRNAERTDMPLRVVAADLTREQILNHCHQEIPYRLTVQTEKWQKIPEGGYAVIQSIRVAKPSHKAILIGAGGEKIKRIRQTSTQAMIEAFECKIRLNLRVCLEKPVSVARHRRAPPNRVRRSGVKNPSL